MKRIAASLLALGAVLAPPAAAQDFTGTVKAAVTASQPSDLAVQGADKGWFFLRKELEHLAEGDLAAADLAKVNREGTDPIPAIKKYAEELKALGVELLLVPVPPKAAIYPEKLDPKIDPATVPSLGAYYAKLKEAGVEVLDLEAAFKAEKVSNPSQQLYCATDSHWSPYACQLVAGLVAAKYKSLPQVNENALRDLIVLPAHPLEFQGDLLDDARKASVPKESLPLARAGLAVPPDGKDVTTVETDAAKSESPILVMGDSHLQVFRRGGAMLAQQGGFVDHLQVALSIGTDEYSMQAGGADGPRREIARATVKNPDFWAKKKVVIWVFTVREFTFGKWNTAIPAKVQKKS